MTLISIHALLAESDLLSCRHSRTVLISIHALLAESDRASTRKMHSTSYFYPRSPCGERPDPFRLVGQGRDFYPRSPCGERRAVYTDTANIPGISIHALLAESDRHRQTGRQP